MLRAQSAPQQEVNDANCTYAASGIWHSLQVTVLCNRLAVAQDSHLQRVKIPEAAYVQFTSLTS